MTNLPSDQDASDGRSGCTTIETSFFLDVLRCCLPSKTVPKIWLVVAEEWRPDGSTKEIVGWSRTREEAQAWVNVLGFEIDEFRGLMTAWLAEHPDPDPGHFMYMDRRRWCQDRRDAELRFRARMMCQLGARASIDMYGSPGFRVESAPLLG